MIHDESSFPFIAFLDPNIVVPLVYVKLGEYFHILDLVYKFRDQRKGIMILHS